MRDQDVIKATVLLLGIFLSGMIGCSSLPKLKDFNQVSVGMSKAQVIDELGEPKTTKAIDGREILVYDARDGDELKPRWVVLEDREVIFFGRPGEYEGKRQAGASGASVQVSPVISPVISPVFNNTATAPLSTSKVPAEYQTGERKIWFHPAPGEEQ